MNQLLISGKVYMTPELKKKKVIYKGYLLLSVFIICMLLSYYIYGEYQGIKDEALAQDILSSIVAGSKEDTTMAPTVDNAIVVYLDTYEGDISDIDVELIPVLLDKDGSQEISNDNPVEIEQPISNQYKASNGKVYNVSGIISIPKIDLEYPILSETTEELLRISVCKFWGPEPNEVGNLCIAGHNYTNTRAFSQIYKLEKGDIIEITDLSGETLKYEVYSQYVVNASDTSPTSQITHGKKEITLITCKNGTKERRIVKALAVEE